MFFSTKIMTTEEPDFEKIEEFYNLVIGLPDTSPEKFTTLGSGFDGAIACDDVYRAYIMARSDAYRIGPSGRAKLWKYNIMTHYYSCGLEEVAQRERISVSISNRIFRSRVKIRDKDDGRISLDIWSPKFSTFLSPILGNRVKAKLKKVNASKVKLKKVNTSD